MLLRVKQLPGVDNLRSYPVEIVKELEELLLSGGSALPDPRRKGFYDLENHERTFFIQISSVTGRVMLLATWLRPAAEVSGCSEGAVPFRRRFQADEQGQEWPAPD